jgi:hypothetical protein
MFYLFHTLQDLQAWNVSLVAQSGLQFDLRSAQGKLIASLMAALTEFERDLLRERIRSGIAAARERGFVFGRRPGQRIKADRFAPKVLKLVREGQSYREISSKNLRRQLHVGISPSILELVLHAFSALNVSTCCQRLRESKQRARVAGIAGQVITKDLCRVVRVTGSKQRAAERLTHGIVPVRRLDIDKIVLGSNRTMQ